MNEPIRVLYVDDDPLDQRAFARHIEENKLPYQCTHALTVAQASEKIQTHDFDFLVVDYRLADGTGLDLIGLSEKKPVILLTVNGSEAVRLDIMKRGVSDYIIKDDKGAHWPQLVNTIEQILKTQKTARRPLKLLVVEDDRVDQKAMIRALEPFSDYQLTMASSIKEAKEHLRRTPFDLAILDVGLPDGTITELSPLLRDIPFIVATGAGHEEYAVRAYQMGASDYLIKDTDRFYLKLIPSTIEKAFRQHETAKLNKSLIGVTSHEMRNPLVVLMAGSANLRDGLLGPLNEKQGKLVDMIHENAGRLSRLIDSMLDLSRFESGKAKMNREFLNINELIQRAVHRMQQIEKRCRLTVEPIADAPKLWADADMMERTLTNLLSNACRFAKETVIVRSQMNEKEVEISVSDDGPGIPEEQRKNLFSQFEQLRRAKGGGYKGTGLGLSICKEIVELHGGRIWMATSSTQGAEFHFTIPIDLREKSPT